MNQVLMEAKVREAHLAERSNCRGLQTSTLLRLARSRLSACTEKVAMTKTQK